MKKIFTLLAALFMAAGAFAQAPEKMSYQAVVRNGSNNLVTSSTVGMQISIVQGTANGAAVYVETQTPTTNANGLVSFEIGTGTTSDNFSSIDWANGPYFIKTETDPSGGTNYSIMGTSQLLSVPFALYAKTSGSSTPGPQGPQGPAGANGADGAVGATGPQGQPGITPQQASDIEANNAKVGITTQQANAIIANTAKVGITPQQASDIEANNAKVGITTEQANAIIANTAKVGITPQQASDIEANNAKVGITTEQANAIIANTAKVGITSQQANDIIANNAKVGITTAQANAIIANTAKIGVTPGTAAGQMKYWNGTAWVVVATTLNEGATLQMIGGVPTWVGGTPPPPPPPSVTNPTTGKIWMDRNLGATQVATSSTDAASYGDLYQWGRGKDGHQIRTSTTTTTKSTTDNPGHSNFILGSSAPNDWRSPQNTNLWQGVNGINNPCPSGYRLPTETELNAERLAWSTNNAGGAFASPLKLPQAGYRSGYTGSINVSTLGCYWSSTLSGPNARYLYIDSSNADMDSSNPADGSSVRCLKD